MSEMKKVNVEELNNVAGGNADGYDYIHDLNNFVYRTVCNVIHYDDTACLTLRRSPDGDIISGFGWQNGDSILVHSSYAEDGWLFAYADGVFGYVKASCVC